MPSFRHHERRHSWPSFRSELGILEPRILEMQLLQPALVPSSSPTGSFQPAMAVPLIAEELHDDDAEMAGIIRSSSYVSHKGRLWSRLPIRGRRDNIPVSASTLGNRNHVHRTVLRRWIRRPPLSNARSLFVMPTNTATENPLVISRRTPQFLAQPVMVADRIDTALPLVDTQQCIRKRRHWRSHSEQPRSWKRPSADLWTLDEE